MKVTIGERVMSRGSQKEGEIRNRYSAVRFRRVRSGKTGSVDNLE